MLGIQEFVLVHDSKQINEILGLWKLAREPYTPR